MGLVAREFRDWATSKGHGEKSDVQPYATSMSFLVRSLCPSLVCGLTLAYACQS